MTDTLLEHAIEVQQQGYDKLSEDMQKALDDAIKLINGDQKELLNVAGQMLNQLQINKVDEAEIINGIIGDSATTISSSTQSVIDALAGESGISSLLTGLGLKQDETNSSLANLNIADAINNRTPDAAVSEINTALSIVTDSLGNNVGQTLNNIETTVGTIGAKFGTITNGSTALGKTNAGGASTTSNTTKALTTSSTVGATTAAKSSTAVATNNKSTASKSTSSAGASSVQSALAKKYSVGLAKDPIYELLVSAKARSKTISATEKKQKSKLWQYIVHKYGHDWSDGMTKKLAALLGVKVSSKLTTAQRNNVLTKLKKKGYAKGTKNVEDDLMAWTNENMDTVGPEMIVRPSDGAILTPLKAKDSVIPANLADNLFKWGAISPDKFITNPFIGKWSAEGGGSVTNNADYTAAPQTVEMHFDSLFNIEGNVDESVMPRLENLGKSLVNDKDFQKNVIKFVTKDFVRESKKQGIR